jgi:hypothetical protein
MRKVQEDHLNDKRKAYEKSCKEYNQQLVIKMK